MFFLFLSFVTKCFGSKDNTIDKNHAHVSLPVPPSPAPFIYLLLLKAPSAGLLFVAFLVFICYFFSFLVLCVFSLSIWPVTTRGTCTALSIMRRRTYNLYGVFLYLASLIRVERTGHVAMRRKRQQPTRTVYKDEPNSILIRERGILVTTPAQQGWWWWGKSVVVWAADKKVGLSRPCYHGTPPPTPRPPYLLEYF